MRRYFVSLLIVTLAMVMLSFAVMYVWPERWLLAMPFLALYFGVICLLQHWIVTKALYRSPKAFVQQFLGTTVGVLFVHMAVLAVYLFTHPTHAKPFTLAFLVGFVVSWVFETAATIKFIRDEKKKKESQQ